MAEAPSRLDRHLGVGDAVVIGLGSMIGAGVFAAVGPAARAAGAGMLIGLGVAAFIAYCNATSSAQLAARYPASGGTYVYGRERLGPFWGYLAGWGFVVGKTASCAGMALTVGAYAATQWQRPIALAAVAGVTAVNAARRPKDRDPHPCDCGSGARGARPRHRRHRVRRTSLRRKPRSDHGPRRLRHPPVRRAFVLRLRRLRPNRHARRGGP